MTIDRRTFAKALAGFGAVAAAPALAQGKTVDVLIKNNPKAVFFPATVTIHAGDTVRWTNPGIISHSVTCDPAQVTLPADISLPTGAKPFDSGTLEQDAVFSHSFTEKGTYKYVCKFHEAMGMVGTVIVL